MSTVVWKHVLKPEHVQTLALPKDSYIVAVREQYDLPCIWFECNEEDEEDTELRTFAMIGTGAAIPDDAYYLGMTHHLGGQMVFHIYELLNQKSIDKLLSTAPAQSNTSA
jgi:hypothetical protein